MRVRPSSTVTLSGTSISIARSNWSLAARPPFFSLLTSSLGESFSVFLRSRLLARARVDEHLVTVSLRPFAGKFTLAFDPKLHVIESGDIQLNDIAGAQAH